MERGKLIVIEGTDGSGKSTQVNMLSKYIKDKCFGCTVSQWKTSRLISGVIDEAKERNVLNTTTFSPSLILIISVPKEYLL